MPDIQHFGTKGMKWGVRKEESSPKQTFKKTAASGKVVAQTTTRQAGRLSPDALSARRKEMGKSALQGALVGIGVQSLLYFGVWRPLLK